MRLSEILEPEEEEEIFSKRKTTTTAGVAPFQTKLFNPFLRRQDYGLPKNKKKTKNVEAQIQEPESDIEEEM